MTKDVGIEEGFYRTVADLLGCDGHRYEKYPFSKRTRWNNRAPGNGRYPGHGIVRRHSASDILVQLHHPLVSGLYSSEAQALTAIRAAQSFLTD